MITLLGRIAFGGKLFFCFFFFFQHFKYTVLLSSSLPILLKKFVYSLMGVPLYLTSCFSHVAFEILSLSSTFGILIIICV